MGEAMTGPPCGSAAGALPAPVAGTGLRSLLDRADLSPEAMARQLNSLARGLGMTRELNEKTPYKWLRGSVPRDPWPALVAHFLSVRLGVPVAAADLGWDKARPDLFLRPADCGLTMPWTAQGARTAVLTVTSTDDMMFFPVNGIVPAAPAVGWMAAAQPGGAGRADDRPAGGVPAGAIQDFTASMRQLDGRHGSGLVLPLVRVQLRAVAGMLAGPGRGAPAGAGLPGAAADLLALAGWLTFDHGNRGLAQRYWLAGLRAAHAAGDRACGANILRLLSLHAGAAGQSQEAIALAEAARHGAGLHSAPRTAAVLAFGAALAHAQAGDHASARAAVDDARQALARPGTSGPEPSWASWLDAAMADAQEGTAFLGLRDWDQASSRLRTALRTLCPSRSRDRAVICAQLGLAYAGQGQPDRAGDHGLRSARILAAGTHSGVCTDYLRDLDRALRPYRTKSAAEFRNTMNRNAHHE
jgi:hypothetical protein